MKDFAHRCAIQSLAVLWGCLLVTLWLGGLSQAFAQGSASPPLPLAQGAKPLNTVATLTTPPLDLKKLRAEDEQRLGDGLPPRFAQPVPVEVIPATHGTWEVLAADRRLWRLRINAPDAVSINLGFSRYHMPPGGQLFLYTADYQTIIGPFTAGDNEKHGQLWTPLLPGGDIVVEVSLPAEAVAELELALTAINQGYVAFSRARQVQSGSCNIDVACPIAADWQDIAPSVGVYTVDGSFICTGSLVNNTAQDLTPYFLTAAHCGITGESAPTVVVYWNYEHSTCRTPGTPDSSQPGDGSLAQFNSGAVLRASYGPSDMALIELDDPISPDHNLSWAGWDVTDEAPAGVTTIHHPDTEEKRISFDDDPTAISSYLDSSNPGDGTHLRIIDWDLGTTEPGSSGAPLFNQAQRIVGQLHGGYAACGNEESDWYGRLFTSWTGGGSQDSRLSDWLDPLNGGAVVLDGYREMPDFTLLARPNHDDLCAPAAASFDVTVDAKARDYLPYLFGANAWMLVRHAGELPARLPLLYAHLTT